MEPRLIPRDQPDMCAGRGEKFRRCQPDAAGASSDEGDTLRKIHADDRCAESDVRPSAGEGMTS
jgi:hypothetical protein